MESETSGSQSKEIDKAPDDKESLPNSAASTNGIPIESTSDPISQDGTPPSSHSTEHPLSEISMEKFEAPKGILRTPMKAYVYTTKYDRESSEIWEPRPLTKCARCWWLRDCQCDEGQDIKQEIQVASNTDKKPIYELSWLMEKFLSGL